MVSNRTSSAPVMEIEPDLTERLEQQYQAPSAPRRFSVPHISNKVKMRLKIGISVVMIASLFLFGKIDLSKSFEIAMHANLWFLGGAVLMYFSSTLLNAYRWQLLANAVGLRKPFYKLVQFCFVGLFFNLFLPSTVGGDFSRCYYLSKGTGRYGGAAYSVLADRAVGIAVLFMFASLGILLGPGGSQMAWALKAPIFLGTLGIFGVLPFMPRLTQKILGPNNIITKKFNDSSAKVYWQDKKLIGVSLALSVLMQVVVVTVHILMGYALGLTSIPLWYYFVFYPSVAVLGFVTPSFNGIGIREWAYTYFLTMVGIDNSHALTYAIMWLGLTTITSLFGGIVYVAGHFKISKEEAEKLQSQAA
jgi:glycosyltransferase 2 family protein